MIAAIWKYIWGYVIVEIKGNALERLLNRISASGIELWSIKRISKGFRFKMLARDYYRLRPLIRYRKCKARIVQKKGWPFITYRLSRRMALMIGIMVFVIILKVMTSFLWFINIEETPNVPREDLQAFVDKMGIHRGMLLKEIDLLGLEQAVRSGHRRVAWVDANLQGTRLSLKIVEKKVIEETDLTDVIAEKSGVVLEIIPLQGKPLVKEGDTVIAGDTLIKAASKYEIYAEPDWEGNLPPYLPPDDGVILPAEGSVSALVWYEGYGEAERIVTRELLTGRGVRAIKIKIGSKIFHYSGTKVIPYEHYRVEKQVKSITLWRNIHLPIEIINEDYLETVIYREERTLETSLFLAEEQALNAILQSIPQDAIIRKIRTFLIDDGDKENNIVRKKVVVEVEEDIAQLIPRR